MDIDLRLTEFSSDDLVWILKVMLLIDTSVKISDGHQMTLDDSGDFIKMILMFSA